MSLIVPYDQWKEQRLKEMQEIDKGVECPDCDGDGEIECCECGYDRVCKRCDGAGEIAASDHPQYQPSPIQYYEAVKADMEAYCSWTRKDFSTTFEPIKQKICNALPRVAHYIRQQERIAQQYLETAS